MASNIKFKRSAVQNRVPTTAQLDLGELALNTYDGKLYTEINTGSAAVVEIGSKLSSLVVDGANGAGGGDVTFHGQTAGRDVTWDYSQNSLEFADIARATFGDGRDLEIYHDGNNSLIRDNGVGNLRILGVDIVLENSLGNVTYAEFSRYQTPTVDLYADNQIRLSTTVDGADIFGTGSLKIPVGTTAQRSGSPVAGDLRYNSTTSSFEGYSTAWGDIGAGGIGVGSDASNPRTGIIQNRVGVGFTDLNIVGAGISVTGYGTTVFVDFNEFKPGSFHRTIHNYTATAGQTTFAGLNYVISEKQIAVYLNGARLSEATYTATSGTTVVLDVGASVGDEVEIVNIHTNSDVDRKVNTYTATAGQTTFTGLSYNSRQELDVYLNGIRLATADYTATSGSTVVLAVGASVNDIVDIVSTGDGVSFRSTTDASGDRFTLNNVGIGTDQTPDKLNVRGNSSFVGVSTFTSSTFPLVVHADTAYQGILVHGNAAPTVSFAYQNTTTPDWKIGLSGSNHTALAISEGTGNSNRFTLNSGGGASISGTVVAEHLGIDGYLYHNSDTDTKLLFGTDTINLQTGGSTRLSVTNTGASITGNLAVSGVLTYDDVTNVDSVGIITARDDIKVVTDNKSITFGASNDLSMKHDGTNSYILNNTGSFIISADTLQFNNRANNETKAKFINNGAVELYHDNIKSLETTSEGIEIKKTASGQTARLQIEATNGGQAGIELRTSLSGTNRAARIDMYNQNTLQWSIFNDYQQNGTNDFSIKHGSENAIRAYPDAQVELFYDNSKKLETDVSGVVISGRVHANGANNIGYSAGDNIKSTFGNSDDLQIYHNGSHSVVQDSGTGKLLLGGDIVEITNAAINEVCLRTTENGAVELMFNDSKKLETTSAGAEITGNLVCNSSSNQVYLQASDGSIEITRSGSGAYIDFKNSTSEDYDLRINEEGGFLRTTGGIRLYDNKALELGTGSDLKIYQNGTSAFIDNHNQGHIYIRNNDGSDFGGNIYIQALSGEDSINVIHDGGVELYHNNTKMFETTSEGFIMDGVFRCGSFGTQTSTKGNLITATASHPASLTFDHGGSPTLELGSLADKCIIGSNNNQSENLHIQTGLNIGTLTGGTTRMEFRTDGEIRIPGDGQKMTFGASQDLEIFHDGSHSRIKDVGTGILSLSASQLNIQNAAVTENMAEFFENGAVKLYHDNTMRFETTGYGAYVSCTNQSDGLLVSAAVEGAVTVEDRRDSSYKARFYMAGSGPVIRTLNTAASDNTLLLIKDGLGNVAQWTGEGHYLPGSNNAYDLGSTSKRFRNVYTNDLNLSNEGGGGNDVDGTTGDYTIQEGADELYLINNKSGKKYKFNLTEVS